MHYTVNQKAGHAYNKYITLRKQNGGTLAYHWPLPNSKGVDYTLMTFINQVDSYVKRRTTCLDSKSKWSGPPAKGV